MSTDFDCFMTDRIRIYESHGRRSEEIPASVSGDQVTVMDTSIDFDEGQIIEREIRPGKVERYRIHLANFVKGFESLPSSWQLKVQKVDEHGMAKGMMPSGAMISATSAPPPTSVVINNHDSNVQIGDGNVQNLQLALNALEAAIDKSDASDDEKSSLRKAMRDLVAHPLFCALAGGIAGGLTGGVRGGSAE